MARYIKATECADIISARFYIRLGDLVDAFAEVPTADVVEVVRCGDCKHRFINGKCLNSDSGYYEWNRNSNSYCDCGERSVEK